MPGMIFEALKLMGMGVGSVFVVLAIFFFLIKALMFIFPQEEGKTEED